MKLKIINKDGTVFELEGTKEECLDLMGKIQANPVENPSIPNGYSDLYKWLEEFQKLQKLMPYVHGQQPLGPLPDVYRPIWVDPTPFTQPYMAPYPPSDCIYVGDPINTWPYRILTVSTYTNTA